MAQIETIEVGRSATATELIARADAEHRSATQAARSAFRAALGAGRLLNQAKTAVRTANGVACWRRISAARRAEPAGT